jgi:hypothetical protein
MLCAWTASEVSQHKGKNLFLQKMQFLQFCVHSTCPWLQLCYVKVLHKPHENFWNTNICNFGCFIPTQCNSYLISQKYKFLQFIPVQHSPIFKMCLLCTFLYTAPTKLNSFHKTFSNIFFMTPTLWKYYKQQNIFPHAITTFSKW